ncbi:MAG: hypothetical protein QM756_37160 [Polyangiaceae bacterium]
MALKRRDLMLALPGVVAAACAPAQSVRAAHPYKELAVNRPSGDARGTVLVCMPETSQTREVWTGLCDELGPEFALIALKVDGRHGAATIGEAVKRHKPSGIVLMNNPTVLAYRDYQLAAAGAAFPPAVIVMTSFLDGYPQSVSRATGISYEVPLITVVTNLRRLIAAPIERVGVVLRSSLRGFVQRQAELASREQTRVLTEVVGLEPNPAELRRALRRLKQRAQAISGAERRPAADAAPDRRGLAEGAQRAPVRAHHRGCSVAGFASAIVRHLRRVARSHGARRAGGRHAVRHRGQRLGAWCRAQGGAPTFHHHDHGFGAGARALRASPRRPGASRPYPRVSAERRARM